MKLFRKLGGSWKLNLVKLGTEQINITKIMVKKVTPIPGLSDYSNHLNLGQLSTPTITRHCAYRIVEAGHANQQTIFYNTQKLLYDGNILYNNILE